MKFYGLFILLTLSSCALTVKPRPEVQSMGSNEITVFDSTNNNSIYNNYNLKTFITHKPFLERIDVENFDAARLNAVIFFLTNQERGKHNLSLLLYHPSLEQAAQKHSENMVNRYFFSHNYPFGRGSTPTIRAQLANIANPFIAENIALTFTLDYIWSKPVFINDMENAVYSYSIDGPPLKMHTYLSLGRSILKQWMNSPGHRQNILSASAKQLGCGSGFYWRKERLRMPCVKVTQDFQLYEMIAEHQ